MTPHILDTDIQRLAHCDLSLTEWARVRRHLFECDACLRRLIDIEAPLAAPAPPAQPRAAAGRAYVY